MTPPISRRRFLERAALTCVTAPPLAATLLRGARAPTLRIGVVGWRSPALASRDAGVTLAIEEARHAAALFGGAIELGSASLDASPNHFTAIVGDDDVAHCSLLARRTTASVFFNALCAADSLRSERRQTVFHVAPSDSMLRRAAAGGDFRQVVVWHPSLIRYGADTLNQRFHKRFGRDMNGEAWCAWFAIKVLWETSLRAQSSDPGTIARLMASDTSRFDGHKGRALGFRDFDHQLDQPLYAVRDEDVVEIPPTAQHGGLAFVSNELSHDISILDLAINKAIATIAVPGRPRGIQASPDGRRVYVATSDDKTQIESSNDAIVAIDVATRKIVGRYRVGSDPEQFAITPDGSKLYASNEDGGTATAIDVRTGKLLTTLVVGIEPEGVAVSPDGRLAAVTSETSNSLSIIDARRHTVVGNLLVDLRPRAAAFSPDGQRLFVTAEIGGTLTAIDVRTRKVLGTIAIERGDAKPVGVAVSPDGSRVYVAAGRANTLSIIDARTLKVLTSIPVGERPWGVAVAPDGQRVYTANGLSNSVSVVDVATNRVVATIAVGKRPWGLAIVR